MDEMKSKALGAGLMAIGVAIPLYEKVRSTAEAAGDTPPGRFVGGAMKLVEPLARPVLGLIPGLGGDDERSSPRGDGSPVTAPDRETSSATDSAAPPAPTRGSGGTGAKKAPAKKTPAKKTPAKKTPAKKTPAKKTPAKRSTGRSAAKKSAVKGATLGSRPEQGSDRAPSGASRLVTLPLPTYTRLTIPAILDALNGLTKPQLREIRDHEIANENRAPIIDRIDELLAVPLPGE